MHSNDPKPSVITEDDPDLPSHEDSEEYIAEVNFDVYHPVKEDAHDISGLLSRYLDSAPLHGLDLADLIISEARDGNGYGSVVSTDEGEDVVGVISCVDLSFHKSNDAVVDIYNYLNFLSKYSVSSTTSSSNKNTYATVIDKSSRTGLLLYERLVNITQNLTPHMYRSLYEEILRSIKPAKGEKKALLPEPQLRLDNLIVLSRIARLDDNPQGSFDDKDDGEEENSHKKDKKEQKRSRKETPFTPWKEEDTIYMHPEDVVFLKHASVSFTFPIEDDPYQKSGEALVQRGLLIVFPWKEFGAIVDELFPYFEVDSGRLGKKPDE